MPKGQKSRPEEPGPQEYEELQRKADALRRLPESGQTPEQQRRRQMQGSVNAYARYTGIGIQFVLVLLIPMGLGYWLDGVLGTSPWLLAGGALLGGVGAMVWVVYSVGRTEAREGKKPQ